MKVLILISLMISSLSFGKEIQFNQDDTLNAITMSGFVSVRCNDRQYPRSFNLRCASSFLENGDYQKLQILNPNSVDLVTLNNKTTGRAKSAKVNTATSMTKRAINLWIDTLTQRALVDYGQNEIEYKLYSQGNEISSGTYLLNVVKKEQRRCPNGFLYYSSNFCPSSYSACDDYFRRYRYCK